MKLKEKLTSIKSENIISEINELLKTAKITVSCTGLRLFQVEVYEGSVTLNELADIFLKAPAFHVELSPSIGERLACDEVWEKIQNLYEESEKQLSHVSLLQKFTYLREYRPYCRTCHGDPQAIIQEWDGNGLRCRLFEFRPKEFKSLFDDEKCIKIRLTSKGDFLEATKQMLEEAYQKQKHTASNTLKS